MVCFFGKSCAVKVFKETGSQNKTCIESLSCVITQFSLLMIFWGNSIHVLEGGLGIGGKEACEVIVILSNVFGLIISASVADKST